jgi:phosphomannomutase/phosphoglucomutase
MSVSLYPFQVRPEPKSAECLVDRFVHRTGFREYDARWFIDRDVNYRGLVHVGHAFGTLLRQMDPTHRQVVLAWDYRAYSQHAAHAVGLGLVSSGLAVIDIGLATSPMGYFAQYHLGIPALAMVTASHNENGWTGIKMGYGLSRTLGPSHMSQLRDLALSDTLEPQTGGSYRTVDGVREAYIADAVEGVSLSAPPKIVVATGNGTAGHFAPDAFAALGCEVVPLQTELDWDFPNGTPNPESESFMAALVAAVLNEGATLGFGLDGDGDRLGVVDASGRLIYADKIGLLLGRWMAPQVSDPLFVVDVKCTSLLDDPAVIPARIHWEKTGHSYIKAAVHETGATAGFERSGHFFFAPPFGRGYDDGLLSGIRVLQMLDDAGQTLAELYDALPTTYQSPNFQPQVSDERKYGVVEEATTALTRLVETGETLAGGQVLRVRTINGARAECADGSWLLIRASSNRPSLVVMAESQTSAEHTAALIGAARELLAEIEGVAALTAETAH